MSPTAWIISLLVFAFLFWLVARGRSQGDTRRLHEQETERENSELRHVVTEMSMERHLLHHGTHHGVPKGAHTRRDHR